MYKSRHKWTRRQKRGEGRPKAADQSLCPNLQEANLQLESAVFALKASQDESNDWIKNSPPKNNVTVSFNLSKINHQTLNICAQYNQHTSTSCIGYILDNISMEHSKSSCSSICSCSFIYNRSKCSENSWWTWTWNDQIVQQR